jgi:hypothetical protein
VRVWEICTRKYVCVCACVCLPDMTKDGVFISTSVVVVKRVCMFGAPTTHMRKLHASAPIKGFRVTRTDHRSMASLPVGPAAWPEGPSYRSTKQLGLPAY